MKKKGFTLVELLAVIVVLGVVLSIAIPKIMLTMEDVRKNAFKVDVSNIIDMAKTYATSYFGGSLTDDELEFNCNGTKCSSGLNDLNIDGKIPLSGSVFVTSDGKASVENLYNGEFYANANNAKLITLSETEEPTYTRAELAEMISNMQDEIDELQSNNQTLMSTVSTLQSNNQTLLSTVESLQSNNQTLTSTVNALQSSNSQEYKKFHPISKSLSITSSTSLSYTGMSISIPEDSYFCINASAVWTYGRPLEISINSSTTQVAYSASASIGSSYTAVTTFCNYTSTTLNYYVWAKYENVSSNSIIVTGFYVQK